MRARSHWSIIKFVVARVELLGLEDLIKFEVVLVEKFAVEPFAILCLSLDKRYTPFVQLSR